MTRGRDWLRSNYASLRGPARTLGWLHLADSIGNGLFIAGSAVYFVRGAGLPAQVVALGLSLAGASGFVSSVVLGRLADRVGARRLLGVLLAVLAGCFALFPLVDSAAPYLALMTVIGALEYGCSPAFSALILDLVPEPERVTARAALRSVFNVGFSAGSLLAAGALAVTSTSGLAVIPLGNALSFLVALVLLRRLPAVGAPPAASKPARFGVLADVPFLRVVALSALLALHSALLLVGIPLWLVSSGDVPSAFVPLSLILNTVIVVLFQVAASRGADTLMGAATVARRGGLAALAACLVLAAASHVGGTAVVMAAAAVAVLLCTLAELWQCSSAFGLSFGLAGERNRAEYLGGFNLHMVFQGTIGPAAVTWAVVTWGAAGWLALAAVFAAAAALVVPAVRGAAAAPRLHPEPVDVS